MKCMLVESIGGLELDNKKVGSPSKRAWDIL